MRVRRLTVWVWVLRFVRACVTVHFWVLAHACANACACMWAWYVCAAQDDASEYAFDHVKRARERIHDVADQTLKIRFQVHTNPFPPPPLPAPRSRWLPLPPSLTLESVNAT